jgi:hypothetical protein
MSPARLAGTGLALAALAVVVWGGYGRRWPWTGINGHTATLWDWLHLLLLPVAFGLLPVLLSEGRRLRAAHRWAAAIAIAVFAAFVVAGYAVPWGWTGFAGNRLWDWLELLALPLAVTIVPVMDQIRLSWGARQSLIAGVGLCAFVAIVLGGYVDNWTWTGFHGNTLWDWLQLLLLPLLLPTVVVPRLKPRMEATLLVVEDRASSAREATVISAQPAPATAGHVNDEPAQAGPAPPEPARPRTSATADSLDDVQ